MITTRVTYEKLTDLELSILETIEDQLMDLTDQFDYYENEHEKMELIGFQFEVVNDIYFAILEDFVKHGKAVEE